jgi:hypothetical protein
MSNDFLGETILGEMILGELTHTHQTYFILIALPFIGNRDFSLLFIVFDQLC